MSYTPRTSIVIPANAGIHGKGALPVSHAPYPWIPAFAGMTKERLS
jgi:hypothetical protein